VRDLSAFVIINMQHYELFFIVSIKLAGEEQKALLDKISGLSSSLGMKATVSKEAGRRKLSYPIKKETQGNYFLMEFDGEQAALKKFDRELRLMSGVLRFVILKKHVKTPEEIDREQKIREKIEGKKREAERVELAKAKEEVSATKGETKEKKPEDSKKISLEDLDKKLDDILKEEV